MRQFMAIAKALADENRVRVLLALRGRELCVCQIIKFLGLAPSTVSKHISILKQAYLVDSRKEGRWMHYQLPGPNAPAAARQAIDWVHRALGEDPRTVADEQRIKAIKRLKREELCAAQR